MEILFQAVQDIAATFFSAVSPSRFGLNLIDMIIFVVIVFYAYEGYLVGFAIAVLDLLSFILSFLLALALYSTLGTVLVSLFAMPVGFANALGFFIVALVSEILLNVFFRYLLTFLPRFSHDGAFSRGYEKIHHLLGVVPGIASSLIILSFLLTVIVALPSSPVLKRVVTESKFGGALIARTAAFEGTIDDVFGGAIHDTLNVITIKPHSDETVTLHFTVASPTVDEQAEQTMLQLVNSARIREGLSPLVMDPALRDLARDYAKDMLQRGYFSHYNPEGLSPFDRMTNSGIQFSTAGENLALAPSVQLAHQGLMKSPGHRANILSSEFGKVGIGVMDGGIYGKMFVQEFTN